MIIVAIEKIKEAFKRFRKFSFRKSIVFPIVFLLLFIGAGLLLAGYLINRSVFYAVFEEREHNKAHNTHHMINSLVSQEVTRISDLTKILRNDTDVVYGLFYYNEASKNIKPLKAAMDQLYPKMNVSFFVMVDTKGRVLYRAGHPDNKEPEDLSKMDVFRKALEGDQIVTTISTAQAASIVAITPIYVFGKNKPSGVLILGCRIDDAFAAKISKETNSHAFIAMDGRIIAGSYDISLANVFNPTFAQECLKRQRHFFHINQKVLRSYAYIPLKIVDKDFCLLIESDVSVIQELLSKNLVRTVQWGIALLACIALLGVGLAFLIIYPLNGLYRKALDTIHEYSSGSDLDLPISGNEISTLVRANDVMLETIKNHLAERTQAEEAFRETSGTLQALVEAAPLAVIVSDPDGIVRVWNQAAIRMFGWSASETLGRPNPLFDIEDSPELDELKNTRSLLLQGEKLSNKEIRCKTRNGSEIILSFSGAPLFDAQENISSIMAIMSDVTDSKKAAEEHNQSEERHARFVKMEAVGNLAGSVARDFNDLLSVITKYSELLLARTDEQNPARTEIEKIFTAGEQAATLTRQLLAFSRKQILKPELLRMDEVVENMRQTLNQIISDDIKFIAVAGPKLWLVRVDPSQIEQILANLCLNARDAMLSSGGKLTVRTKNITLEDPFIERELTIPPGRYATLSVTDNGINISDETLSRIFEPFFTMGKRTGLGLATVYGIVKQSGGFIRVSSIPGEGTTFTVYFPAENSGIQEGETEEP